MTSRSRPSTRSARRGVYLVSAAMSLSLLASACGNGLDHTAEPKGGDDSSAVTAPKKKSSDSTGHAKDDSPKHDASASGRVTHESSGDKSPAASDSNGGAGSSTPGKTQRQHSKNPSNGQQPSASSTPRVEPSRTGEAPSKHPSKPEKPGSSKSHHKASASSSPSPTSKHSKHKSSGTPKCSADDLHISLEKPEGGAAAGSRYILLTFKNTSSKTCKLIGHAGVSFVGKGNGTKLGESAKWSGSDTKKMQLDPDKTAPELLKIGEAGNYDAKECAPTTADGFRVYPPRSYSSVLVKYKAKACQRKGPRQLTISPVGTDS